MGGFRATSARLVAALSMTALLASACASTTESNIGRTATENLLLARAADKAVEGLSLPLPTGATVFVDETYFQTENSRYAISAIRGALSDAGYRLTRTREDAAAVVAWRRENGASIAQTARHFDLSPATVKRYSAAAA